MQQTGPDRLEPPKQAVPSQDVGRTGSILVLSQAEGAEPDPMGYDVGVELLAPKSP